MALSIYPLIGLMAVEKGKVGKKKKKKEKVGGSDFLSHDAELSCPSQVGVIQFKVECPWASKAPSSSVDLEVNCYKKRSSPKPSHQERIIMWPHRSRDTYLWSVSAQPPSLTLPINFFSPLKSRMECSKSPVEAEIVGIPIFIGYYSDPQKISLQENLRHYSSYTIPS